MHQSFAIADFEIFMRIMLDFNYNTSPLACMEHTQG